MMNKDQKKQPYEKPAVKRFSLRPEEAVLGTCKTPSQSGPGTSGLCHGVLCKTPGS